MNLLCEECEVEPAVVAVPKATGVGEVYLCDECLRWLFEYVTATYPKERTLQ